MNLSEYIVRYLKEHEVDHFFGYQGTMIAYFVDAICNTNGVYNHVSYNEQGAALAACGFSKLTGKVSVAYSTSGPGAVNLVQGIADAYYDSAPVLFITGQLNHSEYTNDLSIRQQGFQEIDIIKICRAITKKAIHLTSAEGIRSKLDSIFECMLSGRKGPALIDIPMDIQRIKIDDTKLMDHSEKIFLVPYKKRDKDDLNIATDHILKHIKRSRHPIFVLGNGIGKSGCERGNLKKLVEKYKIPTITTMLARDLLSYSNKYNFGYIGYAYGHRYANFIANVKADLIISLGARLCPRQIGNSPQSFASNAQIIRIDNDAAELERVIHSNDIVFCEDVNEIIEKLLQTDYNGDFSDWTNICDEIKKALIAVDRGKKYRDPNRVLEVLSEDIPDDANIVCDVGQHQIWSAQSIKLSENQRMLFSGGHGAMGFALPAAIGAYFGNKKPTICISGDGAFQMNIQELQWVFHEKIPIVIIVLNNHSLGLIRQQQDGIFDGRHFGSTNSNGYGTPVFAEVAKAYGIFAMRVSTDEILSLGLHGIIGDIGVERSPLLLEVEIDPESYAYPKTVFGDPMHNQKPYMDQNLFEELKDI